MKKYSEKLKDPRWQKKRLNIFERDKWNCQLCHDKESTLHVHHRYYEKGHEPWDYPDMALITLCEFCHQDETEQRPEWEYLLLQELRKHFSYEDIRIIAQGFSKYEEFHLSFICASVISYIVSNKDLMHQIYNNEFSEDLMNTKREENTNDIK